MLRWFHCAPRQSFWWCLFVHPLKWSGMKTFEELEIWENLLRKKIQVVATAEDPAHDLLHFERVVLMAKKLCRQELANPWVVIPAAWLHDLVIVPKNDPRRSQASRLSAAEAGIFLREIQFPEKWISEIQHAIECHSFSANIACRTVEAEVVQDADRLDGLGAIGLARCFATAGMMKRAFYSKEDPFCETRKADDSLFTIDHFFVKLFKTAEMLKTKSGREEGARRVVVMKNFLVDLGQEI